MSIHILPPELLHQIFTYLAPSTFLSIRSTCTRWRHISDSPKLLRLQCTAANNGQPIPTTLTLPALKQLLYRLLTAHMSPYQACNDGLAGMYRSSTTLHGAPDLHLPANNGDARYLAVLLRRSVRIYRTVGHPRSGAGTGTCRWVYSAAVRSRVVGFHADTAGGVDAFVFVHKDESASVLVGTEEGGLVGAGLRRPCHRWGAREWSGRKKLLNAIVSVEHCRIAFQCQAGVALYSLAYGATGGRKRGGGGGDAAVVKLLQTGWVPTTDILPASIVLAAHLSYPMLLDEHILLVPADLGPAGAKPLPLHIPEANDASTAPVYLGRVPFRSRNATLYLLNHSGRVSVVFLECTAVLTAGESEYSPLTVLGLAPGHFAEDVEEAVATVVDAEVSCLVALRYRGGEIWLYELRLGSEGADQVVPATLKGSLVGREAGVERIAFSVCGNRLVSLVGVGRGGAVVTWMFNVVPTERSAEIRVELASMKRRRRFWRR